MIGGALLEKRETATGTYCVSGIGHSIKIHIITDMNESTVWGQCEYCGNQTKTTRFNRLPAKEDLKSIKVR